MKLRKLSDADAAELLRVIRESLAHLRPWVSWVTDDYDASSVAGFLAATADGWANGTMFNHAVTVDGAIAGVAGADLTGHPGLAEIGYWLHPAHTGRGHATAATRNWSSSPSR